MNIYFLSPGRNLYAPVGVQYILDSVISELDKNPDRRYVQHQFTSRLILKFYCEFIDRVLFFILKKTIVFLGNSSTWWYSRPSHAFVNPRCKSFVVKNYFVFRTSTRNSTYLFRLALSFAFYLHTHWPVKCTYNWTCSTVRVPVHVCNFLKCGIH